MKLLIQAYKDHFKRYDFVTSLSVGIILLLLSLFLNFQAGVYAMREAGNQVTDIILSNTTAINVDFAFTASGLFLVVLITFLCLRFPARAPFTLKAVSLFILIRAFSITLTHIGPYVVPDVNSFMSHFTFGADLFFSGHTGLPIMIALLYWDKDWIRISGIALSIIFAIIVLLGHLHYSIDVFAAPFMTYSIFSMAKKMFHYDYVTFHKN